jgi:CMP-2-keto-3-deoxyoctulosonic acid synthetase
MATNWNLRRSVVVHAEKIEDGSERLKYYLTKNNFIDSQSIETLMNQLETMNVTHILAAIERAETSKTAMDTLIGVLKNEKKRKEATLLLRGKQEEAILKEDQKQQRLLQLTNRGNPHQQPWNLPPDPDNNADMAE